jgi:hypothetical protein|tara:strand:- start:668 stop:1549 length:882 start_codon:yes stop_codon:yes gene_type:complete
LEEINKNNGLTGGSKMNKITFFVLIGLILGGCQEAENQSGLEPETQAVETAQATPDAYYEYLWCKQGENYSTETSQAYVADWNAAIDELEDSPYASMAYFPRGWEADGYDGLWVLRWDDKGTSEKGWSNYVASGTEDTLQEKHPEVLKCGSETGVDRFGFDTYIPRSAPAEFSDVEPPYFVTNQFCTFNEGKSAKDVRAAIQGHYLPFLEASAETNPDSTYFFMIGRPDFEPAEPMDFNWINLWATVAEGEASQTAFNESDEGKAILSEMNEAATCQDAQPWDARFLRKPVNG